MNSKIMKDMVVDMIHNPIKNEDYILSGTLTLRAEFPVGMEPCNTTVGNMVLCRYMKQKMMDYLDITEEDMEKLAMVRDLDYHEIRYAQERHEWNYSEENYD